MAEDAKVGIEIEAEDDSEAGFKSAEDRIDSLGTRAERAGSVGFQQLARGAATASGAIQNAYGAMTRLDLTQITLEQSAARLAASHDRLNQSVAEFGAGSQQAIQAQKDLEASQANAEKTAIRAHASYLLVGLDMATMAARAIPAAQGLYAMATAAGAATTAFTALQVASGAILVTAAALAVVGVARNIKSNFTDPAHEAAQSFDDFRQAHDRAVDAAAGQRQVGDSWFAQYSERVSEDFNQWPLLGKVITTVKEETDANMQDMADATAGMANVVDANLRRVNAALRDMGVNMDAISSDMIPSLVAGMGYTGEEATAMADKILASKAAEEALLQQMIALGPAYTSQINFTRRKGEATDDFKNRILEAVGAENAAKVQIDDTTQSFRLQTDATDLAAQRLANLTGLEKQLEGVVGDARLAIVQQSHETAKKGETTEDFQARMKALVGEEAGAALQFDETGRAILDQADATREASQAAAEAKRNGASAAAAFGAMAGPGGMIAPWALQDLASTGLDPIGNKGNRRWDLESMLNTGPGVDVTGIARGTYAPFGGGFKSGGKIGSTDLSSYGSRTVIHDRGDGGAGGQGGGSVNMGGVTIVVYAQGTGAQAVQQGVLGAMSQVQTRAAARRTV